ncbi:MAG: hypothetical protein Q9220_007011 [cf. Caloplaca sp. 1 TL-2023]
MDPFSITTGVIAVVGAIDQAAKCVKKLQAIRQAPSQIVLLLDEVADLWEVLRQVETAQRPPEYRESPFEDEMPPRGLDRLIRRTSAKLRELDALLQHHSLRTQRRTPDWGWLRGKQKADALRADLSTLRMDIATALSAITSKTVNRVESAIDGFHAEQVKSTQLLTSFISGLGFELPSDSARVKVHRERYDVNLTLQYPVQAKQTDCSALTETNLQPPKMTRHVPGTLRPCKLPATSNALQIPRTVSWASSLWRHGLDGNVRAIQDLFSQNLASPFDVQVLGGSVLHYAADHGHWDLCKFLIGQGATVDNEDDFHNTPSSLAWGKILSGALIDDESSMVANMFADTDFLQTRQFSILHKIVLHLIPRTIESELAFSTRDLNAVDSSGRTALAWAAARGDDEALATLLGYDADVNLSDSQGNTPLHHAKTIACIDYLLNAGADKSCRNIFEHTPLHMVCRRTGSLQILKHLVAAGIDIDAIDNSGETALGTAAFNKHVDCAFHLVHSGADIDITNGANGANDAPIHLAMMRDEPAIILLLLNNGAKLQKANSSGRTILHHATGLVSAETIEILRAHGLRGIDVDARDIEGKTAEDLLQERADDDDDPLFKPRFLEMLAAVRNAQELEEMTVHKLPKLAMEIKGSSGLVKAAPVIHITPVPCDEDEESYDYGNDTHSALVFFDALEEIEQGLQVVDIAA